MLRRDYIQRMIEEFARVLGHAMGLKAMDRNDEGVEELRNAYKTWFGLEAELIEQWTPDELLEKLLANEEFPPEKIDALARGLKLEGELLLTTDPYASADRLRKALVLFLHLERTDTTTFSIARKTAVKELQQLLGE